MNDTTTPATSQRWLVCSACGTAHRAFGRGPSGRPDASCPSCRSLERHRFLVLLLRAQLERIAGASLVLDVAPTPAITRVLESAGATRLLRMDFDPSADRRTVDVQASITQIPLADRLVDVLLCYHVLEHVPDDAAAMRELARVLAPGGVGLVQVPWKPDRPTDEDPDAPTEERIRRFGQADHVRYYGADFELRLAEAGLRVDRFTPGDLLAPELLQVFRLAPSEAVWLVRRADSPPDGDVPAAQSLRASVTNAAAVVLAVSIGTAVDAAREDEGNHRRQVEGLRASERAARREAERWERAYRRLRNRLPVRVGAGLAGAARRARGVWDDRRRR